jgi:non-canonical (house-cleaning) NTP pyrophosphatase
VRQGKELGEADDQVFGRHNSKQQEGAIGLLTGRVIDRTALYEEAVVMALIPFKNPTLFP